MEEKKVPKLRFKGFVQEWEQRKLGELGEVTTGKAFSSTDFDNQGEYLVITNKDISDSSKSQNVVTNRINISDNETIQRYNLSGKNILVTMDGVNLGKSAIFSNSKALLAQRVGRIKSNQLEFIYQITSSNTFLSKMRMLSVGNAIKHISLKQISDYSSLVPKDTTEQQKIGAFFKQFDDIIALHQRKIEQLKLLKQAFLEKMLANQENVPELRFADFDVYWEQHTLGETTDIRAGRDYKHLKSGNIPVYGTGGYMLSVDDALSFDKDAIGIGRKGTIDNPYILKAPFWTVDTLFYVIPRNGNEIDFFYSVFQKINWKSKDESTGVPSLSKSTINSILVYAPSKDEQKKIGTFFKYFDENILIHQHKVNLLKKLKKAFLQKLFI